MKRAVLFLCVLITACAQVGPLREQAKSCSKAAGFFAYSYCIDAALRKSVADDPNEQASVIFSQITWLRTQVTQKVLSHQQAIEQLDRVIADQASAETEKVGTTILLGLLAAGAIVAAAYALSESRDENDDQDWDGDRDWDDEGDWDDDRSYAYREPPMCAKVEYGYPKCRTRKACGDTCIHPTQTCKRLQPAPSQLPLGHSWPCGAALRFRESQREYSSPYDLRPDSIGCEPSARVL